LGGCGGMILFDDSEKKADARLEKLLEVIANKDENAMKEIFSKQAVYEAINFDENMRYLFNLFQGHVVSWERDRYGGNTETVNGKKYNQLLSWYTVTTNKDKYRFYISDYIIDTINPDNVGMYTLHVIRAEEADADSPFIINWEYKEVAGIYKPE